MERAPFPHRNDKQYAIAQRGKAGRGPARAAGQNNQQDQHDQPDQMAERQIAKRAGKPFEQAKPGQKHGQSATTRRDQRGGCRRAGRCHQQGVGHRRGDQAGDDRHVQVRIGVARNPPDLRALRDMARAPLGADVEIDPPHQHRSCETGEEGAGVHGVRWCVGKGRARHHDPFAQRDQHEQGGALGHVTARNVPVRPGRAAKAGRAEKGKRPAVFDSQRHAPQRDLRLARCNERAGEP